MSKETCWKNDGYCSEKCFKYIYEELPRVRKEKEEAGFKCLCDEPMCGKCLGVGCTEAGCPTHSDIQKKLWKEQNSKR